MRILPIALLLLLIATPVFSQTFDDYRTTYGDQFENRMDSWHTIAIAAILICLFSNLLIYMAGMALQSENLKRYARAEFLQVTASALMIFFAVELLYTLATGSTGVSALDFMGETLGLGASRIDCAAATSTGGQFIIWNNYRDFGAGPLGAFKCKVQEKINALDRAYNNALESNKPIEKLTSMCINLLGLPIYCGDWDFSLHMQVEKAHLVSNKVVSLLMPLHAQYVLAEYLQKNMLQVFLPAGLVMRIFPFTRGVGGLFIALGVGFFFVFPTFFLLTDPTFVKVNERQRDTQEGVCFTGFRGSSVILSGVLSTTGLTNANSLATASAEELVYQITIATIFYPFIALAITLIFVRAVTPLLGGDMGELMKMVARLG